MAATCHTRKHALRTRWLRRKVGGQRGAAHAAMLDVTTCLAGTCAAAARNACSTCSSSWPWRRRCGSSPRPGSSCAPSFSADSSGRRRAACHCLNSRLAKVLDLAESPCRLCYAAASLGSCQHADPVCYSTLHSAPAKRVYPVTRSTRASMYGSPLVSTRMAR